jgi:RND family efflux transporter MFP subunit
MADPGTMASPGVPLLQVDRAGALQLQVTVDESAIGAIHKGMKVPVSIDGANSASLEGKVAEIDPAADAASHSFMVKIDLPASSQLRAGMYGTAEFANGVREAILIPRSAVVMRGSLACAYVLDSQGIAQLRYLTLGAPQGNLVEALSGISGGEKLVDTPADRELAGKRIEAQP